MYFGFQLTDLILRQHNTSFGGLNAYKNKCLLYIIQVLHAILEGIIRDVLKNRKTRHFQIHVSRGSGKIQISN